MSEPEHDAAELKRQEEISRAVARHWLARFSAAENQTSQQFATTSNWLNASLLAINGGGAIAALSAAKETPSALLPAGLFAIGLLFTMLSAAAIQELLAVYAGSVSTYINYWAGVEIHGERDEEEEQKLDEGQKKAARWNWVAPALGWVAGGLFISGLVALGLALNASSKKDTKICARLRQDMLSDIPKRSDSRELFVTLKCS